MAHTEYELREFLPLGKMFQAVIKVKRCVFKPLAHQDVAHFYGVKPLQEYAWYKTRP